LRSSSASCGSSASTPLSSSTTCATASSCTACGVDADDPQLAELALLGAAVAEGEDASSQQRLLNGSQFLAAGSAETLGGFKQTFFGLTSGVSNGSTHR